VGADTDRLLNNYVMAFVLGHLICAKRFFLGSRITFVEHPIGFMSSERIAWTPNRYLADQ